MKRQTNARQQRQWPVRQVHARPDRRGPIRWTTPAPRSRPAEGQTVTDTITVTVNDGKGGTATQEVTVTITGTNDIAKAVHRRGDRARQADGLRRRRWPEQRGRPDQCRWQVRHVLDRCQWQLDLFAEQQLAGGAGSETRSGGQGNLRSRFADGSAKQTITIDVGTNDAPVAADNATSVDVGASHFNIAEFNFNDGAEGNNLQSVIITRLPTDGALTLNGQPVTANTVISAADIAAGKLVTRRPPRARTPRSASRSATTAARPTAARTRRATTTSPSRPTTSSRAATKAAARHQPADQRRQRRRHPATRAARSRQSSRARTTTSQSSSIRRAA